MNPEMDIFRSVLNKIISGKDCGDVTTLISNGSLDWPRLKTMLKYHEIAPFAYITLKQYLHLLPDEIREFLYAEYKSALISGLTKEREYRTIYDAFKRKNIELVPIKGTSLSFDLYKKYPVRPMCDIDVLIREEDYEKSSELLKDMGYRKELDGLKEDYWRSKQCHVTFLNQNKDSSRARLELHFRLDLKRNNRDIADLAWKRTRSFNIGASEIQLLSPEDTLFSLALHQRRYGKTFCLKYVLDAALIIKRHEDALDWDYVLKTCKSERLSSCLYFLFLQVDLLVGAGGFIEKMEALSVGRYKKGLMRRFISNNMDSLMLDKKIKDNYLKSHFLLYDSFIEPVRYIMYIPLEQFSKYYSFSPYSSRTKALYRARFFYFIMSFIKKLIKRSK